MRHAIPDAVHRFNHFISTLELLPILTTLPILTKDPGVWESIIRLVV